MGLFENNNVRVTKRAIIRKEPYVFITCESPQLNLLRLCKVKSKWPFRLSVRTLGFHPRKTGSTPVGATNNGEWILVGPLPDEKILIMVFPIQRMSTIQNGIGIQHPVPRTS
jgi:hypothetical protein